MAYTDVLNLLASDLQGLIEAQDPAVQSVTIRQLAQIQQALGSGGGGGDSGGTERLPDVRTAPSFASNSPNYTGFWSRANTIASAGNTIIATPNAGERLEVCNLFLQATTAGQTILATNGTSAQSGWSELFIFTAENAYDGVLVPISPLCPWECHLNFNLNCATADEINYAVSGRVVEAGYGAMQDWRHP